MSFDLANLSRSDMQMITMAVRRGFKISDVMLDTLPQACAQIVADKTKPDRDRLAATKLLVAMHIANIRLFEAHIRAADDSQPAAVNVNVGVGLQVGADAVSEDRLAAIAAEWGVSVDTVRAAIAGPAGGPGAAGDTARPGDESETQPA